MSSPAQQYSVQVVIHHGWEEEIPHDSRGRRLLQALSVDPCSQIPPSPSLSLAGSNLSAFLMDVTECHHFQWAPSNKLSALEVI